LTVWIAVLDGWSYILYCLIVPAPEFANCRAVFRQRQLKDCFISFHRTLHLIHPAFVRTDRNRDSILQIFALGLP
jgi:hypothetical protein